MRSIPLIRPAAASAADEPVSTAEAFCSPGFAGACVATAGGFYAIALGLVGRVCGWW